MSRHQSAQIAAVEPLVRAVYDRLYGEARWHNMRPETRESIVRFAIDQARIGHSESVLVHVTPAGTKYHLTTNEVLTKVNGDQT